MWYVGSYRSVKQRGAPFCVDETDREQKCRRGEEQTQTCACILPRRMDDIQVK